MFLFQINLDDDVKPDMLDIVKRPDSIIDIPRKKSKFEEYAAYVCAAASMEPIYFHLYEQWSCRQLSAFRPLPHQIPPKDGYQSTIPKDTFSPHLQIKQEPGIRHPAIKQEITPPHLHHSPHPKEVTTTPHKEHHKLRIPSQSVVQQYANNTDPPRLQHPEKVVMHTESEKFERSFQPNVALAPKQTITANPTVVPHKKYRKMSEDSFSVPKTIESEVTAEVSVISPVIIQAKSPLPPEHNSVIIETKSAPVATTKPYNPEIELSTDTDDSFSDASGDTMKRRDSQDSSTHRKPKVIIEPPQQHEVVESTHSPQEEESISYVSRIESLIQCVRVESRREILDIVRILANDNRTLELLCRQKDEIIQAQQRKILEIETKVQAVTALATPNVIVKVEKDESDLMSLHRESSQERVTSSNTPQSPPNDNCTNNNNNNNQDNSCDTLVILETDLGTSPKLISTPPLPPVSSTMQTTLVSQHGDKTHTSSSAIIKTEPE